MQPAVARKRHSILQREGVRFCIWQVSSKEALPLFYFILFFFNAILVTLLTRPLEQPDLVSLSLSFFYKGARLYWLFNSPSYPIMGHQNKDKHYSRPLASDF